MGLLTLFVAALLSRALLAQSSILVARQEEVSTDQDAWDAIEALAASAIVCPLGCAGVLWTVGVCGVQTVLHTSLAEGLECWCERSTGNFADCVTCVEEDGSASPETLQKIRLASGYMNTTCGHDDAPVDEAGPELPVASTFVGTPIFVPTDTSQSLGNKGYLTVISTTETSSSSTATSSSSSLAAHSTTAGSATTSTMPETSFTQSSTHAPISTAAQDSGQADEGSAAVALHCAARVALLLALAGGALFV